MKNEKMKNEDCEVRVTFPYLHEEQLVGNFYQYNHMHWVMTGNKLKSKLISLRYSQKILREMKEEFYKPESLKDTIKIFQEKVSKRHGKSKGNKITNLLKKLISTKAEEIHYFSLRDDELRWKYLLIKKFTIKKGIDNYLIQDLKIYREIIDYAIFQFNDFYEIELFYNEERKICTYTASLIEDEIQFGSCKTIMYHPPYIIMTDEIEDYWNDSFKGVYIPSF